MSRNYDNWERLVAAVVKREQIWQLCHQDSISTISSSDYSCRHLDLSSPISLGSSTRITETFKSVQRLSKRYLGAATTVLSLLLQDVHVLDNIYFEAGTKAVIKSSPNSVHMTEDEFEQQMIVVGNTRHENVAAPWAYYFSEATKFLVYDYYSNGSVYDILHGAAWDRLSWESRMRIAIGAARGIAHIHTQYGGKLAHGNIKSSNIFLNSQNYGCVSEHEFSTGTLSQKVDVYNFGRVLLELISHESPMVVSYERLHSCEPDERNIERLILGVLVDELDMWLRPGRLVVDELDMPLPRSSVYVNGELEESDMLQQVRGTLQVAKWCLNLLAEDRPIMGEVVLQLEKIAEDRPLMGEVVLQLEKKAEVGGRKYISRRGVKKAVWQRFLHFPFGR